MSSRIKKLFTLLVACAMPLALIVIYCLTNPFAAALSARTVSLIGLSNAQRTNIFTAARSLDGCVVRPGEEFSFNRVVGPRNFARGYRAAPSYLGPESPATFGGGICLVSSALYQVALESSMSISQRVAHLRTIHSVPPGFDATVWYGQADLRFRNESKEPVMISARVTPTELQIGIKGAASKEHSPARLSRLVTAANSRELSVEVFRTQSGKDRLVSRDLYRLSP